MVTEGSGVSSVWLWRHHTHFTCDVDTWGWRKVKDEMILWWEWCLCSETRDVQIGLNWPPIGQICDLLKISFSTFGLAEPIWPKLDAKFDLPVWVWLGAAHFTSHRICDQGHFVNSSHNIFAWTSYLGYIWTKWSQFGTFKDQFPIPFWLDSVKIWSQ